MIGNVTDEPETQPLECDKYKQITGGDIDTHSDETDLINRSLVDHDDNDGTEPLENTGDRENPLWDHVGVGGDMTLLQCCTVGIVRTTSNQSPAQYSCSCVHWNVNIQVSSSLCIVSLYEPCRLYSANTPIYLYIND